jgi:hypothetical protein
MKPRDIDLVQHEMNLDIGAIDFWPGGDVRHRWRVGIDDGINVYDGSASLPDEALRVAFAALVEAVEVGDRPEPEREAVANALARIVEGE